MFLHFPKLDFIGALGIAFQHLDELVGIGGVVLVDTTHVEATKAEGNLSGLFCVKLSPYCHSK